MIQLQWIMILKRKIRKLENKECKKYDRTFNIPLISKIKPIPALLKLIYSEVETDYLKTEGNSKSEDEGTESGEVEFFQIIN